MDVNVLAARFNILVAFLHAMARGGLPEPPDPEPLGTNLRRATQRGHRAATPGEWAAENTGFRALLDLLPTNDLKRQAVALWAGTTWQQGLLGQGRERIIAAAADEQPWLATAAGRIDAWRVRTEVDAILGTAATLRRRGRSGTAIADHLGLPSAVIRRLQRGVLQGHVEVPEHSVWRGTTEVVAARMALRPEEVAAWTADEVAGARAVRLALEGASAPEIAARLGQEPAVVDIWLAEAVNLRLRSGATVQQAAELLHVPPAVAQSEWDALQVDTARLARAGADDAEIAQILRTSPERVRGLLASPDAESPCRTD
jgi:hypothetical protein